MVIMLPIYAYAEGEDANSAPTDISLSDSSINENQPSGTLIGTLTGSDPDGDSLSFTLTEDSDDNAFFSDY